MRYFISLILVLIKTSSASAGRLTVERAETFFKTKKPCALAIAPIYPSPKSQTQGMRTNQALSNATDSEIMIQLGRSDGDVEVICVFDGSKNDGTINEIRGCFAGYYNPANDVRTGILSEAARQPILIEGKACTKDTILELLKSEKKMSDFKNTSIGQATRIQVGNFNNVFELYLRSMDQLMHPDLRVLYDEYNVIGSLCTKAPCGPVIKIQDQLAAMTPDPAELRTEKNLKFYSRFEALNSEADGLVLVGKYKKEFTSAVSGILELQVVLKTFCEGSSRLNECNSAPPFYKPLTSKTITNCVDQLVNQTIKKQLSAENLKFSRQAAWSIVSAALKRDPNLDLEKLFEQNRQSILVERSSIINAIIKRQKNRK